MSTLDSPGLAVRTPGFRQVVQRSQRAGGPSWLDQERCDLCAAPLAEEHRHLLDVADGRLSCACQPCSLLFDRPEGAAGQLRRVPDRRHRLHDLPLDECAWQALGIPVGLAYFVRHGASGGVRLTYPSPAGPTQAELEEEAWQRLVAAIPELGDAEADVEALLVNRTRGARVAWLVPIDDCYRLIALFRIHWKGMSGGDEVWAEVDRFFGQLDTSGGTTTGREGA